MSRSRKKTPITGNTKARSEKQDKQLWHRRFRHKERLRLLRDPEGLSVDKNEVSSTWNMAKDGKHWFNTNLNRFRHRFSFFDYSYRLEIFKQWIQKWRRK